MHAHGIRVIGATITSSLDSTATHGTPEVDARRKAINEFIRHGGVFDGVADFDAATLDPQTGTLRSEFQPSSSTGGPGDRLHPNRAGYQAMANSIDLQRLIQ
jgi:lysophospholipase L1-like esterase